MKMISWNVNGLRSCLTKGFEQAVLSLDADVICLQETKAQPEQISLNLPGYAAFYNSAEKKGYSGTAVYARLPVEDVRYGIGIDAHDREGRVISVDFPSFTLVDCYTPNAQRELTRLSYRMQWEDDLRAFLRRQDDKKPVILCGDLNVAHEEIDIKNARANRGNAGFTDEEREKFTELLGAGFIDSFRALYPDRRDAYSWWSYMGQARARNVGWRIDYFVVSEKLRGVIADAAIHPEITGSDHCPVSLTLK